MYVAYYVAGPEIDNQLGIITSRDLARFRDLPTASGPSLGAAIESKAGGCSWAAAHNEYIFATNIECKSFGTPGLTWEISHNPLRPWLGRQAVYVTPLSRSAAVLLPELLPSGVAIDQVPLTRFSSGVIYDLAKPTRR